MKNIHKLIFIFIFLIAVFFRFWHLDTLPSSLNWDEISHGYNAYSLLQTGKDQWGVSWPIFNFRAYGDYPTTFNLYLTIPFVKFLGLNALSIRLPSAIFSTIFVVLVFFFTRIFIKNNYLALIAMFIAAITPWNLFPSRAVFQSDFSQTLLLAGLIFFYHGLKKTRWLILSSFLFALSLYSYHNTRIIVPLLLPILVFMNWAKFKSIFKTNRLSLLLSLSIFLILALPNLFNLFSPESAARNRWVGIINPNSINLINEKRRLFTGPYFLNVALNNKVVYFTQTVFVNYLSLINPLPIFFTGSQNYQFNPPQTGLIYFVFLPFFYLGLLKLILGIKNKHLNLQILISFLICLLPAALTVGDFPSIRATIALPFYFLSIVYGLSLLNTKKLFFLYPVVIIFSVIQFISYWQNYLNYNVQYSSSWQYGYKQAVDYLKENYSSYQHIYFTKKYGEPHEFILFYWPWDPVKYQSDPNLNWNNHADWYWIDGFDKFVFINDWEIKDSSFKPNSLLITSPGTYPSQSFKLIKTINFLDGTPAFDILIHE